MDKRVWTVFIWPRIQISGRLFNHGNGLSDTVKGREYLNQLND
jgi:hypothetical protein